MDVMDSTCLLYTSLLSAGEPKQGRVLIFEYLILPIPETGDGKETRKVFLLRLQWVNPTEIPPWIIQQARNISKLILWEY